eukprot:TRINITY_DN29508_c0_g1_i1.p1 TRINITY_DN29508_c0_g1~~TRINITY_DN29508_c0_g1_i1.p1  ORF type:complete len:262 (+),score=33.73 TRINITY_DN29508_c0_g1_i1:15-800(+)
MLTIAHAIRALFCLSVVLFFYKGPVGNMVAKVPPILRDLSSGGVVARPFEWWAGLPDDKFPGQMGKDGYLYIIKLLLSIPNCRFLVFSVGRDTATYLRVLPHDQVVFLEDDPIWLEAVQKKVRRAHIIRVVYRQRIRNWQALLQRPDLLGMTIPPAVSESDWDVILVDGPAGWNPETPGRMEAIYTAAALAWLTVGRGKRPSVQVLLHDTSRDVEATYGATFLGRDNLVYKAWHGSGELSHFNITSKAKPPLKRWFLRDSP